MKGPWSLPRCTLYMFDLNRLPYDVQAIIFGHLDRKTLLNACLASRSFNELASWPLYSHIIIHKGIYVTILDAVEFIDPYTALQRRPKLRSAVTEVSLRRAVGWSKQLVTRNVLLYPYNLLGGLHQWIHWGPHLWLRCADELKRLPCLTKIHILGPQSPGHPHAKQQEDTIFDIISTLPMIRSLHDSSIPYGYINQIKHVRDIVIEKPLFNLGNIQLSSLNSCIRGLNIHLSVRHRKPPMIS